MPVVLSLPEIYSWCMLAGRRAIQTRGRGRGVPFTCAMHLVSDMQRNPAGQARRLQNGDRRLGSATVRYQNLSAQGITTEKVPGSHRVAQTENLGHQDSRPRCAPQLLGQKASKKWRNIGE